MEPDAGNRITTIRARLEERLGATHVEVIDDSHLHADHPGARPGSGHFRLLVVSDRFRGQSRIAAQRLVYEALAELMETDIHALQMKTLTPEAWVEVRDRS